jgi:hypothetical protein
MSFGQRSSGQKARGLAAALLAVAVAVTWLGPAPGLGPAGDGTAHAAAAKKKAPKVSEEQAKEIALKTTPGEVTSVEIEKKRGRTVYVVEIQNPNEGEKDVWVDMETGEVRGTE